MKFPSPRRLRGLLVMLVLVSAVFLTVIVAQQQQSLRQRAAELYQCTTRFYANNDTSCTGEEKAPPSVFESNADVSGPCIPPEEFIGGLSAKTTCVAISPSATPTPTPTSTPTPTGGTTPTPTPNTWKIREQLRSCLSSISKAEVWRNNIYFAFSPAVPDWGNNLKEIFPQEEVHVNFTTASCTIEYNGYSYPLVSGDNIFIWEPIPTLTPTPTIACALKPKGDAVGGADGSCDGKINILDFNRWRDEFIDETKGLQTPGLMPRKSNFKDDQKPNGDPIIDLLDFNFWRDGFLDNSLPH